MRQGPGCLLPGCWVRAAFWGSPVPLQSGRFPFCLFVGESCFPSWLPASGSTALEHWRHLAAGTLMPAMRKSAVSGEWQDFVPLSVCDQLKATCGHSHPSRSLIFTSAMPGLLAPLPVVGSLMPASKLVLPVKLIFLQPRPLLKSLPWFPAAEAT